MSEYRIYIVGSDGHFYNSLLLECVDDDMAMERARQLVDEHDVELWQRDRKIARFDHNQKCSSN